MYSLLGLNVASMVIKKSQLILDWQILAGYVAFRERKDKWCVHCNTSVDNLFLFNLRREAARPESIAERGGRYTAYPKSLKLEGINRQTVLQCLPRQGRAALDKMFLINSP